MFIGVKSDCQNLLILKFFDFFDFFAFFVNVVHFFCLFEFEAATRQFFLLNLFKNNSGTNRNYLEMKFDSFYVNFLKFQINVKKNSPKFWLFRFIYKFLIRSSPSQELSKFFNHFLQTFTFSFIKNKLQTAQIKKFFFFEVKKKNNTKVNTL